MVPGPRRGAAAAAGAGAGAAAAGGAAGATGDSQRTSSVTVFHQYVRPSSLSTASHTPSPPWSATDARHTDGRR